MTLAVSTIVIALTLALSTGVQGYFDSFSCHSRSDVCRLKDVRLESDHAIQLATFRDLRDPLVVESGRIPHFSRELYKKLPSVTDLTIDKLGIEQLYVRSNLVHLSAVGNAIGKLLVDDDESADDYSMMTLHLSANKLSELPPLDRFVRLMTLVLDSNQLSTVDMGAFANLRELRVLSLANNRLLTVTTTTPTAKPLQLLKLKRISFSGNELDMLDVRNWEFDSLDSLNVTRNRLTRVEGSFAQFPALTRLDLAGNRWYCEWLVANKQLQDRASALDSDETGRCREANMMSSGRYCCNPVGVDGSGFADVFGDKWDELKRLEHLLDTLNSTIANGSATVRPVLEAQHKALTAQLDQLLTTQKAHTRELATLDGGIDRHGDNLRRVELELNDKVDRLRRLVNARWNRTVDGGSSADDESEETLLQNATAPSTAASWPELAGQNEKTLRRLRMNVELSLKQFNEYASASYQHGAKLKSQAERIDTIESGLNDLKQVGKQLETRLDKVVTVADAIYDYLQKLQQRSGEEWS
uniref:Leucine rich immune protein (Short) n=1 Tax=Anopheles dirus TaxID=7168 RepID=A0A182NHX1_9DIPT